MICQIVWKIFIVQTVILNLKAQSTLHAVSPIIWYETNLRVLKSSNETTLILQLPNPCEPINALSQEPSRSHETARILSDLTNWCNTQNRQLLLSIETLCKPKFVQRNDHRRFRRASRNDEERSDDLFRINKTINDLGRQVSSMGYHLDQLSIYARGIGLNFTLNAKNNFEAIQRIESRVYGSETERINFQNLITKVVPILSTLTNDFALTNSYITQVQDRWNNGGKVKLSDYDLLKLFRIDSSAYGGIEYKDFIVEKCYFSGRGPVQLHARNMTYKDDIQVLRPSPFTLYHYQPVTESEYGLVANYIGPNLVLSNAKTGCVTPWTGQTSEEIVLEPYSENECTSSSKSNALSFWKMSCQKLPSRHDSSTVQIKQFDDKYYVYCFPHTILIYKQVIPCPSHVFQISTKEDFNITIQGEIQLSSEINILEPIENRYPASVALSDRITNILMPKINNFLPIQDSSKICSQDNPTQNQNISPVIIQENKLNQQSVNSGTDLTFYLSIIGLGISLLALCIGIYICVTNRSVRNKSNYRKGGPQGPEVPMITYQS